MPTLNTASVEVYIFRRELGRIYYLLLHTAPGSSAVCHWCPVVGTISENEPAYLAAVRATWEATGLRAINLWALDYVHASYHAGQDAIKLTATFAIEVDTQTEALSSEYDDARWITYEQAIDLLRLPGQRAGVQRMHEDIVIAPDRGLPFRVTVHG